MLNKVSQLAWIKYMMMDRVVKREAKLEPKVVNPIHLSNRLGQQWIVDQYCKWMSGVLRYIENNQKKIRAELYSGCNDAVRAGDSVEPGESNARPVILPSSITGSDRFYQSKYLDAMAICLRMGRPHLFVTMTCNPKWPEITAQLKKGQTHNDRPDIVSRVFKQKLAELMKDFKGGQFGEYAGHVHSIEFQKSGLPHAHIIFWMADKDAWRKTETVDKVISAEIPDESSPIYDRVITSMLHGPCGSPEDGVRSCMRGGQCRFHFPQDYQLRTEFEEDGYPHYQRRSPEDGGNRVFKYNKSRGAQIPYTNADVVPYSPWLLKKYDCHINVEYVYSVKSIKYTFKYINKGSDVATTKLESTGNTPASADAPFPRNEVEEFTNKMFVGSMEAAWRLQDNEIVGRYPAVQALPIHLPKQQTVYFNPDSTEDKDNEQKDDRTMLMEYFRMCEENVGNARDLYYKDMPEYFTWQSKERRWQPRKRMFKDKDRPGMIGRVHFAGMKDRERFALRVLLSNTKGVRSFEDLRRLDDGTICGSFMAACIEKNLVSDDHYIFDCMEEQVNHSTNIKQLRTLFVDLLFECEVADPLQLYVQFKDDMKNDFVYGYRNYFQGKSIPQPPANIDDDDGIWDVDRIATNSLLCALEKLCSDKGDNRNNSLKDFDDGKSDGDEKFPLPNFEVEKFYQEIFDGTAKKREQREKVRQLYKANIEVCIIL